MYDHVNKHQMINATGDDGVSENTLLFSVENYLLERKDVYYADMLYFISQLGGSVTEPYNNLPGLTSGKDKYTSHDQLTALAVFSLAMKRDFHKHIWSWLKSHWFSYDNISKKTNFKRIMHPKDILFYGYCAGSIPCAIMLPLLSIMLMVSCFGDDSNGPMKTWVRCKGAKMKITYWLCTKIIKHNKYFGSWKKVFNTYFPDENHPNHI